MAGDKSRSKPVTVNRAIQRLMMLDAIVEDPDLVWVGTADEKATHVLALTRIAQKDLPHVSVGEACARAVRYFPDRLPIGIHLAGRGVIVYVITEPWLDEFRVFLERHAALPRALPAWTLRIVVPPQFPDIAQRSKQIVWNQLLTPVRTETGTSSMFDRIPHRHAAAIWTSGSTEPGTPSPLPDSRHCTERGNKMASPLFPAPGLKPG
jgi:hypothetical protein